MSNDFVVVGIDESDQSTAALQWAAGYARHNGAGLKAIFVQGTEPRVMPYSIGVAGIPLSDPAAWETEAWAAAQQLFASVDPEPDWTLDQVRHGSIGRRLVEAARDASLLVVGKGEHTGLDRVVEGSVSHYCLSHSVVPVVGVPAAVALVGSDSSEAVTEPVG